MEPVSTPGDVEQADLDTVLVGERVLWLDGPPHALFRRLRSEKPGDVQCVGAFVDRFA